MSHVRCAVARVAAFVSVATVAVAGSFALVGAPDPAFAVVSPSTGDAAVDMHGLEVASGEPARLQPRVAAGKVPRRAGKSWARFHAARGAAWQALWDADTQVPLRIFGVGMAAPGANASPAIAETFARAVLAEHIDLLAPGSRPQEFELVTNHLGDGIRTIGMIQRARGVPVIGGQVSFRFKNDRLVALGSEAFPDVRIPDDVSTPDIAALAGSAREWMAELVAKSGGGPAPQVAAIDGPFVRPVVRVDGSVDTFYAMRATVTTRAPLGRWHVWLDAGTAAPIAREQVLLFATANLRYNAPVRRPGAARVNSIARNAHVNIGAATIVSDEDGVLTFAGTTPVQGTTNARGPRVDVINALGDPVTATFTITPDGTVVWNESGDEQNDAQLTTYIHSHVVKEYVRVFAPDLEFLDEQLEATVNIAESCNAFSDGRTINFFEASDNCENTGRLPDVIYHEFGHSMHAQSILPGVGAFDGGFSEGLSDYLAATITGDPGMGRGFFKDDEPLRQLDPPDSENRWPDDIGEVHFTGLIFAGAMWDLRTQLIALHGQAAGVALADRLFYAAVQRASSIPTTYIEILVADDDDGDLSNGTPNECAINDTFGRHGLRFLRSDAIALGAQPPTVDGYDVAMAISGLSTRCPGDAIANVELAYRLRGDDAFQAMPMTDDAGTFRAVIPRQAEGAVVEYHVAVTTVEGGVYVLPANLAQPFYEFYVGEVIPLYCTDFETDPFTEGWTHSTDPANKDEWQWGAPGGTLGAPLPDAAFSGENILATDLGVDTEGFYENEMTTFAESPRISVGRFSDVRLHYRRWLTVEDSFYDDATIFANDELAWRNLETPSGAIHHLDGEWVFQDVPLSEHIRDGTVTLRFEIVSDPGLEFGGWHIDDVCVVAQAGSICGDGDVTGAEQCDDGDGNDDALPDACRTNCRIARCGDGILDGGEQCDDGNNALDDGCTDVCTLPEDLADCGCRANVRDPYSPLLAVLGLLLLVRRRRRPRSLT